MLEAELYVCRKGGHVAHFRPEVLAPEIGLELAKTPDTEVHGVDGAFDDGYLLAAAVLLLGYGELTGRLDLA